MKSLEDAIKFVDSYPGAIDGRDRMRFADFLPVERLSEIGLDINPENNAQTLQQKPWTEEEVLKQLKIDVQFGLEKAIAQRGISTNCMFHVVNMWCHLLENNLQQDGYDNYAISFFMSVIIHYGWDNVKRSQIQNLCNGQNHKEDAAIPAELTSWLVQQGMDENLHPETHHKIQWLKQHVQTIDGRLKEATHIKKRFAEIIPDLISNSWEEIWEKTREAFQKK